jgi:ATP-dependent Lon protease
MTAYDAIPASQLRVCPRDDPASPCKDLVRKVKVGANVPVFVLEYLLGKYCATDDPVAIDAGLKVVNNTLSSNFVRPDEANKAQSMVKDKGKRTLIDKVQVRYLSEDDKHWAELALN